MGMLMNLLKDMNNTCETTKLIFFNLLLVNSVIEHMIILLFIITYY